MFDKSQIMKSAWTIARRFKGNGWTLGQRLAHGLRCAWEEARREVEVQRAVAEQFAQLAARDTASLQREAVALENATYLKEQGMNHLTAIRGELQRRAA